MLKFSTLYIEKCYGTALSVKFMLGLREMDKLLTWKQINCLNELFVEISSRIISSKELVQCTTTFTFLWFLKMFLKVVSYAHQGCIYLIKNTVIIVKLWNIIIVLNICFLSYYILKCNLFLWCKAEFSVSLLQASVSHDSLEIILICWFAAQEAFLLIINEIFCCLIFLFYFRILW